MGSTSQEILRSFCSNTDWNYAVFWQLKHRGSRMVLTLEDAYYDHHGTNMHGTHDPLGLAVAKMSYHVYSLAEGIVGQVAVSGEHQWVFPENYDNCHSAFEFHNVWESQISAGIKTILVVAVGRYGVVQLGSLCKVNEDVNLVNHIRHLFLALRDPLADHAANLMQCNMNNSLCLPNMPSEGLHAEAFPDCSGEVDKAMDVEESNILTQYKTRRSDSMTYNTPPSCLVMEKTAQVVSGREVVQGSTCGSYSGVTCGFPVDLVGAKHENQVGTNIISDAPHVGMTSGCKDPRGLDPNFHKYMKNHVLNNTSSSALTIEAERLITGQSYPGLDSTLQAMSRTDKESSYQNEVFQLSENHENKYIKETERMLGRNCESSRFDALMSSGYTFAGSELLEALGSAFKQASTGQEELLKSEHGSTMRPTDDMSHSQLTFDSGPENLLDAVVANVCQSDGSARDDMLSSRSVQSLPTSMELAEPSGQKKHSIVNPIDSAMNQLPLVEVDTQHNSSDICGAFSTIGFSSTYPSSSSDQFQTSLDMPKKNKKRAKPGESSRPRPRDRQLIQDRIKELRELVPNGAKCSIDSLLERTIKHMLFLQNVTKHADKLSKSANAKMQQKETGMQGSSCAVEVGGHLQVCSIIVENLNKQGMVLIEMLCEECSHFLEIANVIRSLDLVILRGITETQGEKTWICFVTESQNSKVMQRMDILWSLVQIFQPKANGKR
ncbi:Helix-loop-helix DNA-binding domain superfamily [Arabidopsis thaliana x Arabidopsis arenosa]|uniref:Helix-loop-helix DNA-binding domain superfamily n=1 Tax=Arabidopsis thaliana x Arabidopsis arenosa TaxID=1240361 RepID=A0A8T2A8R3_9BRAS|nr:Helix-loop-helix DNA-binding domain superfamily [Arabidopsis thaliana x Arabidopsis arenosa]